MLVASVALVGLFCVYAGLFCLYAGLFCLYAGLFCVYAGLVLVALVAFVALVALVALDAVFPPSCHQVLCLSGMSLSLSVVVAVAVAVSVSVSVSASVSASHAVWQTRKVNAKTGKAKRQMGAVPYHMLSKIAKISGKSTKGASKAPHPHILS